MEEKGVTLIEVIITIFLIGLMSFGIVISINSYDNNKKYNMLDKYLDEKLKVVSIFNSVQMYKEEGSNKCDLAIDGDMFTITRQDEEIIKYEDKRLFDLYNSDVVELDVIESINIEIKDNYLHVYMKSYLE